jgi:hypothetical protein
VCSKDQAKAEGFSPPYAFFPGTENFLCLHCHAARLQQKGCIFENPRQAAQSVQLPNLKTKGKQLKEKLTEVATNGESLTTPQAAAILGVKHSRTRLIIAEPVRVGVLQAYGANAICVNLLFARN